MIPLKLMLSPKYTSVFFMHLPLLHGVRKNSLYSKFEVDITKMVIPVRVFIGATPKLATRGQTNAFSYHTSLHSTPLLYMHAQTSLRSGNFKVCSTLSSERRKFTWTYCPLHMSTQAPICPRMQCDCDITTV